MWDIPRKYIALTRIQAKFSRNPDMFSHLLGTGDRSLAAASLYDALWSIGLRANHGAAEHPPPWRGRNVIGTILQHVRSVLPDNVSQSLQTSITRQPPRASSSLRALDTGAYNIIQESYSPASPQLPLASLSFQALATGGNNIDRYRIAAASPCLLEPPGSRYG